MLLFLFVFTACSSQTTNEPTDESATEKAVNEATATKTTTENAASVTNANKLFVYGDVVASEGCVLQNRFTPGQKIVFRVDVKDALTDEQPENAKVVVNLSTGEKIDMHLASHPPDVEGAPKFWTGAYEVPEDAQPGTLEYFITANTDEKSGEYRPFSVKPSLLTIVPVEEAAANAE